LQPKSDNTWRQHLEREVARWWRVLEARAMNEAHPINPQRVFWELSPRLPDGCIITCDSGSAANWYARDLKIRRGMMASLSGGLATMGPAIPYSIAAKLAHPTRHVIALQGDGAMQMNGINGLITIARLWRQWEDPRLTIMVLNNGDLNQVSWEQRVMEGDPRFEGSQAVPHFPYAEYARLLGLGAVRVEDPARIGSAWDEALAADRPTLLEMVTDPNVPPLPPHVSMKQAREYMSALIHGDADALALIKASAKEVWDGLFPPEKAHA
ncbi:MAG TPA: thiamine pyrophosphate-dependent enzyme, partial [Burkholderiales bacterium]|nr:thiamine pyrophosphate-dependent enzyme [Burkholderiales bacterium]